MAILQVRKLAPCFSVSEFKAKDVVVRQGEKADAMYAIRTGSCAVVVDPHYKSSENKLGTLEPGKTLRIVTLNPGAIIGDITVLASVTKRTASVLAATDVVAYKICRPVFLRRVPPDQIEILRRIANEKMKLTDSKIKNKPTTQALQDRILHGHNLRELSKLPARGQPEQAEEYQELIHLLRRYKRAPVPKSFPEDPAGSGGPAALSALMNAAAASKSQGVSPSKSPPISSTEASPVRRRASPGHTGTEVAARLGAELDHVHTLTATHNANSSKGGDVSSSPDMARGFHADAAVGAAEKVDRAKGHIRSSPRSPGGEHDHARTRHRHSYSITGQPPLARKRRSYSSPDNSPQHAGLPESSSMDGLDGMPHSEWALTSRRADHHDVPYLPANKSVNSLENSTDFLQDGIGGMAGRAVPLQGGQEDCDEEEEQQQQQQAKAAGSNMYTGSAAVSAALSQHLRMDPHTGYMLGATPRTSQLSFAAPRKDVHSAQVAKHAQRNHTPGLAHLQGPPLSAYSDIQAPAPPRTRASTDGCPDGRNASGTGLAEQGWPEQLQALHMRERSSAGEVGAGSRSPPAPDRGALGLWSRPSSSVMQSRRLSTFYHARPMSTSNTLRTIPASTIQGLESRYGANSSRNSLRPEGSIAPSIQTYPPLFARPSVSDTHPTVLTPSKHPLYSAHPTSSSGHLGFNPRPYVSDTHPTLSPQSAHTHASANAGPTSPTSLPPSLHPTQPPQSLVSEADGVGPSSSKVVSPVALAQIARTHQLQQQHSSVDDGLSAPGDGHSLPRFVRNAPPGDDRAPSVFHNQDPLGPVAYTHKPPAVPTQGPLKSMVRLKGSASGPCASAAALANSLSTRESLSDGEKEEAHHRIPNEASAPYRPVQEGHGWSSSNLALPQHRALAAAGGLERYLRQLQYNKELEKLQAMQKSAGRLDAALDKMAGPLLDSKANPMLRKGTAHYRPTVPKAML
ncbi:hypothetical protein DUNSADRAFT_8658 [Dunaliella salina]|uniref:Cyclic nucleotide-binding domain-containing protein n=1 Tax=Dunaliella salina TaxID=3046 RepID=A0ABQ7GJ37_DUNSA|nr:hypothetical protein DUNSADRAFT_8658 [Dunaliella salina]|eukprot:KAF5834617.1 hypothetical protein DUNSADRAFT_8658 [Dunaliella salina]